MADRVRRPGLAWGHSSARSRITPLGVGIDQRVFALKSAVEIDERIDEDFVKAQQSACLNIGEIAQHDAFHGIDP